MLLWAGLCFLMLGVASFAVDRRAAHAVHGGVPRSLHRGLARTTDWAKGAHWLTIALATIAGTWLALHVVGARDWLRLALTAALAFLTSLAAGSLVLHTVKIMAGRRRPRDELEHDLYGFRLFHLDTQYDSFPSGHAMTIFCVAVIAAGLFPDLWPVWFGLAFYLALTRAFMNAHFFSDVFIGSGIGLLAARETVFYLFPALFRPWF
ncbi:MAG TPA: phosphatase PAP2 family protein [Rhizomicrobium sp.]|jgi:membrane-associated phospholipid phosphatase